jgi:hypothetical protein
VDYDPAKHLLRITTGIPILVEAEVEDLDVSVEITEKPWPYSRADAV